MQWVRQAQAEQEFEAAATPWEEEASSEWHHFGSESSALVVRLLSPDHLQE